jgi:hypothetical protein
LPVQRDHDILLTPKSAPSVKACGRLAAFCHAPPIPEYITGVLSAAATVPAIAISSAVTADAVAAIVLIMRPPVSHRPQSAAP